MGQGISQSLGAMFGDLIGVIIGGLGGFVGGGLIGTGLGIDIVFARGNPVFVICVGFGVCIAGLFIGGITGGLIGIYLGGKA